MKRKRHLIQSSGRKHCRQREIASTKALRWGETYSVGEGKPWLVWLEQNAREEGRR